MSYSDKILDYMMHNKGITCKECERFIGTTELRKEICNLKDKGWYIFDVWEEGENRYGKTVRFKRYFVGGRNETAI